MVEREGGDQPRAGKESVLEEVGRVLGIDPDGGPEEGTPAWWEERFDRFPEFKPERDEARRRQAHHQWESIQDSGDHRELLRELTNTAESLNYAGAEEGGHAGEVYRAAADMVAAVRMLLRDPTSIDRRKLNEWRESIPEGERGERGAFHALLNRALEKIGYHASPAEAMSREQKNAEKDTL